MLRFVIDEDLPRSTGQVLTSAGYGVFDVRDHGLRGKKDPLIFQFAQDKRAVLLTGDFSFGNIIQFPLGRHCGVIILAFPSTFPIAKMNQQFLKQLRSLSQKDIAGNLIIIEPGRVRLKTI